MGTLVYAPGIRVHIETVANGIVDVSDDVIMGSINRVTGPSISTIQLALKNQGRKYDGVFSPMDKIIVQLRRVRWLQVFAGYLDTVPMFTVYAQRIDLAASCTLKRIQFFYWDPDTKAATDLLHPPGAGTGATAAATTPGQGGLSTTPTTGGTASTPTAGGTATTGGTPAVGTSGTLLSNVAATAAALSDQSDGGMKQRAIDLLEKVVGWDHTLVHIGLVPDAWFKWAGDIAKSVVDAATIENISGAVGSNAQLGTGAASFLQTPGTVAPLPAGAPPAPGAPATGKYYWPVPGHETISQAFGARNSRDAGGHPGADISAPDGTPIVAVADGSCVQAGPASGFGNWIILQHQGFATVYGHMPASSIRVHPGQTIRAGQRIADVGHEGNSTGAHLHIEWRVPSYPGTKSDPIAHLRQLGAIDNGQVVAGDASGASDAGTQSPEQIDPILPLFNLSEWLGTPEDQLGGELTGPRALMNDVPVMNTLADLMGAAQRSFCSAPNGDFIAWFPDYFGIFGTAAKMTIEDIELQDFQVMWSDQHLKTHQFVMGSENGYNSTNTFSSGGAEASSDDGTFIGAGSELSMLTTQGIASVDFPAIMDALFGLKNFDGAAFCRRYGARPDVVTMPTLNHGPSEFFFALYLFMQNWSRQWMARVPTTFMPELYPGMIMQIPKYQFQAYVEAVQHIFSFEEGGGGFQTQVTVSSFTKMGSKRAFPGFTPQAGGSN